MSASSSSTSTSSCSPLGAETGMIAAHSRSSDTASSCSATFAFDAASVFVTIATFFASRVLVELLVDEPVARADRLVRRARRSAMTSTSPSVDCTSELRRSPSRVRGRCRPGVSTRMSCPCSRCTMPRMARRVVCGFELVIATFSPTSAFVRVDLPTFGRPTIETNPARYSATVVPSFELARVEGRLGVDERLVAFDEDRGDALAPALGALGLEDQPRHGHALAPAAAAGRAPSRAGRPPSRRPRPRGRGRTARRARRRAAARSRGSGRRRGPRPAAASRSYSSEMSPTSSSIRSSRVTRPGDAAVLVDDHREVVRLELHLAQQRVGLHRVGHEHRRAHELADGEPLGVERALEPEPGEVAQVEDAGDVVGVALDHGDARVRRP